jgi:cytochrome c peroxidase
MKALMIVAGGLVTLAAATSSATRWSDEELETLASLRIQALDPTPTDPTNRFADDPAAAALGHRLFFDARLSSNGRVSCGTCHLPELDFQDGKPLAEGVGTTSRRTMPIASTAHSTWLFWDGRKDSQWSQALGPLESPVEHGGSRAQYAHVVASHYAAEYEAVFGPLPDLSGVPDRGGPVDDPHARAAWEALDDASKEDVNRVFANIGKSIAAYERTLVHGPSRFDRYVDALTRTGAAPEGVLTSEEVAGARLFMGKAGCVNCHNGPLFTDDYFHNTGVPPRPGAPADLGRRLGAEQVLADEFNCRGPYSDAPPEQCSELEYIVVDSEEMVRAFKTPSLRNVAERAPYMHAGQIATLEDVVRHYARAPEAPTGRSELRPIKLSRREMQRLVAFLRSLSGPVATPAERLQAPR